MKKIKLFISIISLMFIMCFFVSNNVAHAASSPLNINDAEKLINSVNTYDATVSEEIEYDQYNNQYKYLKAVFNMTNKKGKDELDVSSGSPQVTFLTHGLSGSSSHWTNDSLNGNYSFNYSDNSILELLSQNSDCNIYRYVFTEDITTKLPVFQLYQVVKNGKSYSSIKIDNNTISDNSKHSLVIFDAYKSNLGNDYIYSQFNIMASSVLNDLMILNGDNKIPRVNLIGHSRGGITNIQYALDHPDLIDSIFSLGTPYLGSTTASIDNLILNGAFTGNSVGEDDITDAEVYMDYLERWNNNYDSLYKNIDVHAIGGYSSLDTLIFQLLYNLVKDYVSSDELVYEIIENILKFLNIYVSTKLLYDDLIVYKQEYISYLLDLVYLFIPNIQTDNDVLQAISSVLNLIFDELQYNPLTLSYDLLNDGLVDLPSQLGCDGQSLNYYKGFRNYIVRFSMADTSSFYKVSEDEIPVVHNLEARNLNMLKYIVKNIEFMGGCSGNTQGVAALAEGMDANELIERLA